MLRLHGSDLAISTTMGFSCVRVGKLVLDDGEFMSIPRLVLCTRDVFLLRNATLRQQTLLFPYWLHTVLDPDTLRMLRSALFFAKCLELTCWIAHVETKGMKISQHAREEWRGKHEQTEHEAT